MKTWAFAVSLCLLASCKTTTSRSFSSDTEPAAFELTPDSWKEAVGTFERSFPVSGPDATRFMSYDVNRPVETYTLQLDASGTVTLTVKAYNEVERKQYTFKINNGEADSMREWLQEYKVTPQGTQKTYDIGYDRRKGTQGLDRRYAYAVYSDKAIAAVLKAVDAVVATNPKAAYIGAVTKLKIGRIDLIRNIFSLYAADAFAHYDVPHRGDLSFVTGGGNHTDDWSILKVQLLGANRYPELPVVVMSYDLGLEGDHTLTIVMNYENAEHRLTFDLGVVDPHFQASKGWPPFAFVGRAFKGLMFGDDKGENKQAVIDGRVQFKNGLEQLIDQSYTSANSDQSKKTIADFFSLIDTTILKALPKADLDAVSLLDAPSASVKGAEASAAETERSSDDSREIVRPDSEKSPATNRVQGKR